MTICKYAYVIYIPSCRILHIEKSSKSCILILSCEPSCSREYLGNLKKKVTMVTTVLLCLLSIVLLGIALSIECVSSWRWLLTSFAYGLSTSLTVNRFVLLDSTVAQFFLNLLVVVGVYAAVSFVLGLRSRH